MKNQHHTLFGNKQENNSISNLPHLRGKEGVNCLALDEIVELGIVLCVVNKLEMSRSQYVSLDVWVFDTAHLAIAMGQTLRSILGRFPSHSGQENGNIIC